MTTLQVALTVIIPILICGINAWYNITIKFAATPEQAISGAWRIFFTIISWFVIVYLSFLIYIEVTSPEPLTKISLIRILFPAFALAFIFIFWYVNKINTVIFEIIEVMRETHDIQKENISVTKDLLKHVKSNNAG